MHFESDLFCKEREKGCLKGNSLEVKAIATLKNVVSG